MHTTRTTINVHFNKEQEIVRKSLLVKGKQLAKSQWSEVESTPQKLTVSVTLGFLRRNLCYSLPLFLQTQHMPGLSVPSIGIWLIGLEPTPAAKHGHVGAHWAFTFSATFRPPRLSHSPRDLNDALSEMQPASSPSTTHTLAISDRNNKCDTKRNVNMVLNVHRNHEAYYGRGSDTKAAVFVFIKAVVDWNHVVNAAVHA